MNDRRRVWFVIAIGAILLVSVILVPSFLTPESPFGSVDYVKISVLVDNHPNGTLEAPWGLSMLIETTDMAILFDSGPHWSALRNNSESLGIDLESTCDVAVVSHEHPDHVDGLSYISSIHDNLTLYTPDYGGQTRYWMHDFFAIEVEDTAQVSSGIAIIGMGSEQALVINVENLGLIILVGCSHPGVENIVARSIEVMNVRAVYMVMGGFHLLQAGQEQVSDAIDALIQMGVQNIYPLHCSGDEVNEYLDSSYPANHGEASVGFQIVLNESGNN
ncbi:MAG: MBL fold metallo-hydrolase [Candidatus Thorarchaeota archaeon]